MGRNNNDFFHGTSHNFNIGDTVEPRSFAGVAYASTNLKVAASYGPLVYRVEPMDKPTHQAGSGKEFGIYHSTTGFKVTSRVPDFEVELYGRRD